MISRFRFRTLLSGKSWRQAMLLGSVLFLLLGGGLWAVFAATIGMENFVRCPAGSDWTSTSCWDLGRAPLTGDDVNIPRFGARPSDQTNYDLAASVQLHSITLADSGTDHTITGGPIVLQSGAFIAKDNQNFNHTLPGVTLNGPATFTRGVGASTGTLVFNGAITETGGLTLVNNGPADTLRLTVASTYIGSTDRKSVV